MIIAREKLETTIHLAPARRIAYLNNAKVACSSIKKALWRAFDPDGFPDAGDPHDRTRAPFVRTLGGLSDNLGTIGDATFFTVVRNPYTRILSAYLDKIAVEIDGRPKKRDVWVWQPFCRRFRLADDATPTFGDFLTTISGEDPSLLDQHFAPQYVNTLAPLVSCDFVGHMERMEDVWSFLSGFGVAEASFRPHDTNAGALADRYYGPTETDIVRSLYRRDFDLYGYSEDRREVAPVRAADRSGGDRSALCDLIRGHTALVPPNRRRCLASVSASVPELLIEFSLLESGSVEMPELRRLAEDAVEGRIGNWKLIALIGRELLRHDLIEEAEAVVRRAGEAMHQG